MTIRQLINLQVFKLKGSQVHCITVNAALINNQ